METLSIGQLAKKAEVNIQTVRYYERRGLLPDPPRRESGYRQYSLSDLARLRFIKHAKELGFSLRETMELLTLRVDPNTTCTNVKKRAEAKLVDVEDKILALQRIKEALTHLVGLCRGRGPTSECPILEALEATNQNF
ncbi:MAG: MerR family transcriptional regulator [Syntrophobacteria bacterium]|nr:MerR family transcriptional regulator [Deltaproteobacteria bacterium]